MLLNKKKKTKTFSLPRLNVLELMRYKIVFYACQVKHAFKELLFKFVDV